MQLVIFRHLWGIEESLEQVLPKIAQLGIYGGIEAALPLLQESPAARQLLREHQQRCIPMIFTEGKSVKEHVDSFARQVEAALVFEPFLINCHSGRDAFSFEESQEFFSQVLELEQRLSARVAHETHRGRILYNPWITAHLLNRFDHLQLCCDFSHWVCVCERLLDDQLAVIEQCAERAIHVHARVGYEEGPQVPDPRAPEFEGHVRAHERWWDIVWETHLRRSMLESSLTPEFGPPPYLQTLPYTNAPVASLWDICDWQAQRQRERFTRAHGNTVT